MRDLRVVLERESERFELAPDAFQGTLERRQRRHARRRLQAVLAVVLLLTGVGTWAAFTLGPLGNGRSTSAAASLEGTWRTNRLDQTEIVRAFVAAGGTPAEGRAFFAQLGGGATRFTVITLRFQNGTFIEFESGDGGPTLPEYQATYRISSGVLTLSAPSRRHGCTGTYGFEVDGPRLRLHVIHQCRGHDGPYNTTLFASFPLTEQAVRSGP